MLEQSLDKKTVLVTGGARRLGRLFALACARAGADVVIHHGHSDEEAESAQVEITDLGRRAWVFKADLSDSRQTRGLIPSINQSTPVNALVNSAAIFESRTLENTAIEAWERHLAINLTAPFLLSQAFA
ncbi:MAG TPA: SDR family NAD(P)-dependent oxidoreductase, partial [Anaerolineales bacterium]|nr:SDR family NAD(P)-dependent oxidoreductase [Anaerolineales bacterium]